MKTATTTITIIGLACPHCGESHTTDEDRFDWSGDDLYAQDIKPGSTLTCKRCGEKFRAPALVAKVM